jgi:hypothetical protein
MKKIIVVLSFILMVTALLSIDESVKKRFEKTQIIKAKEVEVVKFEAMKPDIERYQKRSETDISKGYYQINVKSIRSTNKVLLNKWLKELK